MVKITRQTATGIAVGVVLAFAVRALMGASETAATTPGRFQLGMNAHQAIILDTATGQAWGKLMPEQQSALNESGFADSKLGGH